MIDKKISVVRPFGPSIAKLIIPGILINKINQYVNEVIQDKNKQKELDHGHNLAGNVSQEFKLEKEFMQNCGWTKFLSDGTKYWIKQSIEKEITKFEIIESWIVRQFENDYNPIHVHGGHISGVGYLKVPTDFGKPSQENKTENYNGTLQLIHGSKMFLSPSTINITPKVGEFYFFPNYLMHVVYPFMNNKDERRSISFNATIDDKIYDVYGKN